MGGEALSTGLRLPSTTPPAAVCKGGGGGWEWGWRRKSYRGRRAPAAFSQPRARPVLPEQPSRRCCGCCELQLR